MPIEFVDLAASEAVMQRQAELHSLPELFFENTRLHPHDVPALRRRTRELAAPHWRDVLRQSCKTYASSPRVALPEPRSSRLTAAADLLPAPATGGDAPHRFSPVALDTATLSSLLLVADGASSGTATAVPRARPAPGDLHPFELYVLVVRSDALAPGLYHFNAWLHSLEALEPLSAASAAARLEALLSEKTESDGAAAAVVTTVIPLRLSILYGDRGYRLLMAETGRVTERLRLGARALGLTAHSITDFFDDRVDRLLGVDGVDEFTAGLCLLGQAPTHVGDGDAG